MGSSVNTAEGAFVTDNRSPKTPRIALSVFAEPVIVNVGIDANHGAHLINEGALDLIAFGRDYIANPDLVERIRLDAPLNEPRPEYFYGNSANGYTDYPNLTQSHLNSDRT